LIVWLVISMKLVHPLDSLAGCLNSFPSHQTRSSLMLLEHHRWLIILLSVVNHKLQTMNSVLLTIL
jgi:hypothetical protein